MCRSNLHSTRPDKREGIIRGFIIVKHHRDERALSLIDLDKDATDSGFFEKYPYFSKLSVPAGTYKGVDYDSPSFQDSALWVANSEVPDDVVYELLATMYTDEGLAHMVGQKKTFKEMSLETGAKGIVTPLHPGAERFWKEKGVLK